MSTLTSRWILSFRQLLMGFWDEDPAPEGGVEPASELPMTTLDFTNETLDISRRTEAEYTYSTEVPDCRRT